MLGMRTVATMALLVTMASGTSRAAPRAVDVTLPGAVGRLAGTLEIPNGRGPFPAAVIIAGFGPSARDGFLGGGATGRMYADWAHALATRGILTLRYDKRGLGGSPGRALSWLDVTGLTDDASSAIRWLAARPEVDTTRTGALGHSQGGDIALAAGRTGGADAVVTMAAPGRPLGRLGTGIRDVIRRVAGTDAARETLTRDPRRDAARLVAPVLVVQGTRDGTVPPSDALLLASARRAAGVPVTVLRVPGAGHDLAIDGRVSPRMWNRVAAFLRTRGSS